MTLIGVLLGLRFQLVMRDSTPPLSRPCGTFSGSLIPGQNRPETTHLKVTQPVRSPEVPSVQPYHRAGFGLSNQADAVYWTNQLGASWYLDWTVRAQSSSGLERWQTVRLAPGCTYPSKEAVRWVARHYPGQTWVIGNEPDVIWQDNLPADQYAAAYHDLYTTIKEADPHAEVAVAGISEATPLRLQYLDRVLDVYQQQYHQPMPVDWWTIHGYVLREERGSWGVDIPPGMSEVSQGTLYEVQDHGNLDLFKGQLTGFRQWMKERGYQDTPLALTEFGILMPDRLGFPPEKVNAYLQETFRWLDSSYDPRLGYPEDNYHLVQRWAWFSLSDSIYPTSDLVDLKSQTLTGVGETYHSVIQELRTRQP